MTFDHLSEKKVKLDIGLQTGLETIILIVTEAVSPFTTSFLRVKPHESDCSALWNTDRRKRLCLADILCYPLLYVTI